MPPPNVLTPTPASVLDSGSSFKLISSTEASGLGGLRATWKANPNHSVSARKQGQVPMGLRKGHHCCEIVPSSPSSREPLQ